MRPNKQSFEERNWFSTACGLIWTSHGETAEFYKCVETLKTLNPTLSVWWRAGDEAATNIIVTSSHQSEIYINTDVLLSVFIHNVSTQRIVEKNFIYLWSVEMKARLPVLSAWGWQLPFHVLGEKSWGLCCNPLLHGLQAWSWWVAAQSCRE